MRLGWAWGLFAGAARWVRADCGRLGGGGGVGVLWLCRPAGSGFGGLWAAVGSGGEEPDGIGEKSGLQGGIFGQLLSKVKNALKVLSWVDFRALGGGVWCPGMITLAVFSLRDTRTTRKG